jgi:predicted ArsR family transcriptional regulator
MGQPVDNQRFLETTRGRILGLLRCETHTVEELAQALDLTDNAVRAHLSTLERDGLVRSAGVRRGPGAGKPSTVYELPPEAEMVFSRAYPPVLGALLEEVVSRLPSEQLEAILVGTGRRLAEPLLPPGTASRAARLRAAVGVLNRIGRGGLAGGGRGWGDHPRLRMSARLGRGATPPRSAARSRRS